MIEENGNFNNKLQLSADLKRQLIKNVNTLSAIKGDLVSLIKGLKTVYITSVFDGEGKTTAALQLAYGLTISERSKVLLVDLNCLNPTLHDVFQTTLSPGLMDTGNSSSEVDKAIRSTEFHRLDVLTYGEKPAGNREKTSAFFSSELIRNLQQYYDYIVLDGHSISGASDAALSAVYFDGTLVVVECEKTKWEVLQFAVEKLTNSGANVLGVILNKRKYYIPSFLYSKI